MSRPLDHSEGMPGDRKRSLEEILADRIWYTVRGQTSLVRILAPVCRLAESGARMLETTDGRKYSPVEHQRSINAVRESLAALKAAVPEWEG